MDYSKACLKRSLIKNKENGFQLHLSLNAGQKYCKMLQWEHSAILPTFIKLPFFIKTFVFFLFFKWPLKTGFTVLRSSLTHGCPSVYMSMSFHHLTMSSFHKASLHYLCFDISDTMMTRTINMSDNYHFLRHFRCNKIATVTIYEGARILVPLTCLRPTMLF